MSQMAAIGQKIKEAQDYHRAEAREHHDKACAIGVAWEAWDIEELRALGAISEADATLLRFHKERNTQP